MLVEKKCAVHLALFRHQLETSPQCHDIYIYISLLLLLLSACVNLFANAKASAISNEENVKFFVRKIKCIFPVLQSRSTSIQQTYNEILCKFL